MTPARLIKVPSRSRPRHARRRQPVRKLGSLVVGVLLAPLALTVWLTGGATSDAAFAATVTVTLRPGDTLSAIALRYHTTTTALAAANGIANPNRITAGATIQVPAPVATPQVAAAAPSTSSVSPTGATVVVRTGDTLSSIASRYHTTVAALVATNNIANPNLVFAGAHLTLPGPSLPGLPPGWGPGGPLPAALVAHSERMALRPAFVSAANASALAPSLVEALCWWESGWQSTATSTAGATGVCQLEPSTVNYARTVLLHNAALDPRNAPDNIAMASAYLHDLTVRDGGDVRTAVAAYYQGLSSVQRKGLLPSTQTYVTGIFNYAAIFAAAG
jgi:LysM repeat protein